MIEFYGLNDVDDDQLTFAIILTKYKNKWIYVRHKKSETWESPGGTRERSEDISLTASRKLIEETNAKEFLIEPICNYSFIKNEQRLIGRLYYGEVFKLGKLFKHEIGEIKLFKEIPENLTYPILQRKLLNKLEGYFKLIESQEKIV